MKKILILVLLCILFSSTLFSQTDSVKISQGDIASFDGILVTSEKMQDLVVAYMSDEEKNNLVNSLEDEVDEKDELIGLKDEKIKELEDQISDLETVIDSKDKEIEKYEEKDDLTINLQTIITDQDGEILGLKISNSISISLNVLSLIYFIFGGNN